jgi:hypothetical protein
MNKTMEAAKARLAARAKMNPDDVDKRVSSAVDRMVDGKLRKVVTVLDVAAFQSSI